MKEFESSFIGVPLPEKYQAEFRELLKDVKEISPLLETTNPEVPHITLYYLDKQPESSLTEIAQSLVPTMGLLSGTKLMISGFDYFDRKDPQVVYLDVQYPKSLSDFRQEVAEISAKYSDAGKNLMFHPHLTVARLKNSQSPELFNQIEPRLQTRLNKVNWTFGISEVVVYGADPEDVPKRQKRLKIIELV